MHHSHQKKIPAEAGTDNLDRYGILFFLSKNLLMIQGYYPLIFTKDGFRVRIKTVNLNPLQRCPEPAN